MMLRRQVETVVESIIFKRIVSVFIVLNAIAIAVESYSGAIFENIIVQDLLLVVDDGFIAIFCAELAMKIYVQREKFLRNGWNIFDVVVILPALIPDIQVLSAARVLRVLQLLLLLSKFASIRDLTLAMLSAVRDAAGIGVIIVLLTYIFGAFSYSLFKDVSPQQFGDIGRAMYTLFRAVAFFEAAGIVDGMAERQTLCALIIFPFHAIMTYLVMNFFVAIAMHYLSVTINDRSRARIARETEATHAALAEIKSRLVAIESRIAQDGPHRAKDAV
jgi:voltage-gated sodium channel